LNDAQVATMPNLSKVEDREKLKPQREPHWHDLSIGHDLGYRPSTKGKSGTWVARYYDPDTRKRKFRSLGDYGNLSAKERFAAAKREAEDWFRHLSYGGSTEDVTVQQACERYAKDNPDAAKRFPRYVYNDPIAKVKLRKLREHHVQGWRERLESMPALVSRNKGGQKKIRPRAPATVNRDMVPFRAALYAALRRGEVETAIAWQNKLLPSENADRRRNLYLDKTQRRALLDALPADAAVFCRGLCLLPLRPGALASLRVADLESRTSTLTIRGDKANGGRHVLLPAETAVLLKQQARDKLPSAPLFMRAEGKAWDKDSWKGPIKEAAHLSQLPPGTTAYTLRHSTITDLVSGGLDLLTVAQISGTSVRMIEKHYGHLRGERAAAALAGLAL